MAPHAIHRYNEGRVNISVVTSRENIRRFDEQKTLMGNALISAEHKLEVYIDYPSVCE